MADYGAQDTSTTNLGANQFPISEAWTPNAGFSAVEGGPQSTDAGGKKSAPVRIEVKDGSDVSGGLTTDAAVTGDNPGTRSAKLRGLNKIWADVWDSVNHRLHVNVDAGSITANAGTNLNTSALAVESGGHLANIDTHTPTQGQATKANSSPVVIASDQGDLLVKGDYLEVPFSTTTAQVVASTDAANYRWVEVIVTSQGTASTITFQASGNNSNYVSAALQSINSQSGSATALTSVAAGIWYGPLNARYFQLNVTGISAGTTAGIVRFYTLPAAVHAMSVSASQAGTWTMQPGNTANTTPWLVQQNVVAAPSYVFKPVKNVAVTAGTPVSIWTPTSGKKFRLLGANLYPTATLTSGILLEDATGAGNEFMRFPRLNSANTAPTPISLGPNGYLSTTVNNQLFIDVTTSCNVEGFVWGQEE